MPTRNTYAAHDHIPKQKANMEILRHIGIAVIILVLICLWHNDLQFFARDKLKKGFFLKKPTYCVFQNNPKHFIKLKHNELCQLSSNTYFYSPQMVSISTYYRQKNKSIFLERKYLPSVFHQSSSKKSEGRGSNYQSTYSHHHPSVTTLKPRGVLERELNQLDS